MNANGDVPRHEMCPVQNLPSEDSLEELCREYFDVEAETYDDSELNDQARWRYHAAVDSYVCQRLALLDRRRAILSFGCGTGRREVKIRSALGDELKIVGVDQSPKMRELASARGCEVFPSVQSNGAPPADSLDAVLCLFSFSHLPSSDARVRTLAAFVKMLRPLGVLIMDVFNANDRYEWGPTIRRRDTGRNRAIQHFGCDTLYRRTTLPMSSYMHYFTLGEITGLAESVGFVVTDLIGVGYKMRPGLIGVPLDEGSFILHCTKPA